MLARLAIPFDAVSPQVDETPPRPLRPPARARWAAQAKAQAVAARCAGAVVVAADTVVTLDGRVFGKPADRKDAARILGQLRARTHQVYTAVHVINSRSRCQAQGVSRTRVTMRAFSPAEVDAYVATGEPRDKAGAYAIQGGGRRLVKAIDGPLDNVVGMPLRLTRRLLRACGGGAVPPRGGRR